MPETKLEYQVENGIVIQVKAFKDTPDYTLTIGQPVKELPISRMGFKDIRWLSFKREICHLPADGMWRPIPAPPAQFPNYEELKRARNLLAKKNDRFMNNMLNGKELKVVTDKASLRLWVCLTDPKKTLVDTDLGQ